MFITFEGIEGCGKSTQISLLAETLIGAGQECIVTREPGGTPIGEAIRSVFLHCAHEDMLPATELLLVTAARVQHVHRVIRPYLQAGTLVLCDRYIDATAAYQGYAGNVGLETVMHCHALFIDALMPDLTILLDCPVETGLARSRERNRATGRQVDEGRFEELDSGFHERVRQGYLKLAEMEPQRFVVLNAEGGVEDIHCLITDAVLLRLRGAGYAV